MKRDIAYIQSGEGASRKRPKRPGSKFVLDPFYALTTMSERVNGGTDNPKRCLKSIKAIARRRSAKSVKEEFKYISAPNFLSYFAPRGALFAGNRQSEFIIIGVYDNDTLRSGGPPPLNSSSYLVDTLKPQLIMPDSHSFICSLFLHRISTLQNLIPGPEDLESKSDLHILTKAHMSP